MKPPTDTNDKIWASLAEDDKAAALAYVAQGRFPAVNGHVAPLRPRLFSDLLAQEFPPLQFLVAGVLAKGHFAMLGGRPKSGKSWLVLQMVQAIESGRQFLGLDTRRARVLYIVLEDGERRVHQRCKITRWQPQTAVVLFEVARFDGSNGNPGPGLAQIEMLAGDFDLIVIDTLISALSGGASENDNTAMAALANELARIAHTNDTAILLVHHTGKGQAENVFDLLRGASSLRGAYDVGLLLERKQNEREALLHLESRDFDVSDMTIRQADDGAGWECLGTGQELVNIRAGRRVVEALHQTDETMTTAELSADLGISRSATYRQLVNAEKAGLVTRTAEKRDGAAKPVDVWQLTVDIV